MCVCVLNTNINLKYKIDQCVILRCVTYGQLQVSLREEKKIDFTLYCF